MDRGYNFMGEYATEELESMGDKRGSSGEGSEWVTTEVAGRELGVSSRTVRNLIRRGDLEAKVEGEGIEKTYFVSMASLESLKEARKASGKLPRRDRQPPPSGEEDVAEAIDRLTARLEARAYAEADLRARLEIIEQAQSTLQEALERERERADREREERQKAQEEANRLREELEAERSSKGFRRGLLFGENTRSPRPGSQRGLLELRWFVVILSFVIAVGLALGLLFGFRVLACIAA